MAKKKLKINDFWIIIYRQNLSTFLETLSVQKLANKRDWTEICSFIGKISTEYTYVKKSHQFGKLWPKKALKHLHNPLMPNGLFNICCPRDCDSRHNGGTSGAPLKPLRDDSALIALSSLLHAWSLLFSPSGSRVMYCYFNWVSGQRKQKRPKNKSLQ